MARDAVLTVGSIDGRGFSLRFSPWNRFRQAVGRTALFRVHLEMEGVPPHAWMASTAAALLGPSCAIERLGSDTSSRVDMGRFRVYAWTSDPCLIARKKTSQIPEARAFEEEEDADLLLPSEMAIPSEVNLLEYRVLIHLLWVEDSTASTDHGSSDDWPSDDGEAGTEGDRRSPRGPRQNFFSCSRGRVDVDDFGNHPDGFPSRTVGGQASAHLVSRLSAAAPEFRPLKIGSLLGADPLLEWAAPPMRLEASSPWLSPDPPFGSSCDASSSRLCLSPSCAEGGLVVESLSPPTPPLLSEVLQVVVPIGDAGVVGLGDVSPTTYGEAEVGTYYCSL